MTAFAPVALFAFRRPEHLQQVIMSLKQDRLAVETELTVFVDGPRDERDIDAVLRTRDVAKCIDGFRSVRVVAAEANRGLASSLVGGISAMLEVHDRVIIIEDDIVVSPWFLTYMNDHLELYKDDKAVASIHAYVYPHATGQLGDTFFIRGADCWGWGTWRRAWAAFESDGEYLLRELRRRGLNDVFNFEGTAPYEEMLIDQIARRNDSWAVRWYASALLGDMLTLYPDRPMAINIGEDKSGTHRGSSKAYVQQLSDKPVKASRIPIVESSDGREAFRDFFRTRYRMPSSTLGRWSRRQARRLRASLRH